MTTRSVNSIEIEAILWHDSKNYLNEMLRR